jgi:hypothetical protein
MFGGFSRVKRPRPVRFIYNSDSNNMFIHKEPPMDPSDLVPFLDEIAQTEITTLFVSPNLGMKMDYPSRVAEMLTPESTDKPISREGYPQLPPDILERGWEERLLKGRESHRRVAMNLHSLLEAGHDPPKTVIELARERGLEVFISFRLNEVHNVEQPDSPILSTFWRDYPEWHIGKPGDPLPELYTAIIGPRVNPIVPFWFPGALNFAIPEVRQRRLAELREVCERYQVDGLDLDFQRFPIYFPFGSETKHTATMTSWVREVRSMLERVSEIRGRPLLLSARVMARPEQNKGLGLDSAEWAREGLIDFLTISHYLRNDYPLPVSEYRRILPPDLPVYGSIEYESDHDQYRTVARRLWDDGIDGIMLFNFFAARESGSRPPFELLNELGNPDNLP